MSPLKIIVFADGRPGHEKQSLGIIEALKRYRLLEVDREVVERITPYHRFLSYCRYFLKLEAPLRPRKAADLLIGAGSSTHIPMLSAKRRSGAKAVVCMSPSRLIRARFDLCFVPLHDRLPEAPNIMSTLGPPNPASRLHANNKANHGLILVGGVDPRSHHWNEDELIRQIKILIEHGGSERWLVTSSPRTPKTTEDRLAETVAACQRATFHPFAETEPGWLEIQYGNHALVWVTGDSVSMVYEALSAGCRVGILPVAWNKQHNKFSYSEQLLLGQKRVITFDQWRDGDAHWDDAPPLDEADRCAREILKRWWPEDIR